MQGTQARRYEEGELVPLHWCVLRMSLLCRHKAPWWKDGQCPASGNGNYHMVLRSKAITDTGSRSEGACTIHSKCSVNTCWVPGTGQGWTENSKQAPAATFQPVWKKDHWDVKEHPLRWRSSTQEMLSGSGRIAALYIELQKEEMWRRHTRTRASKALFFHPGAASMPDTNAGREHDHRPPAWWGLWRTHSAREHLQAQPGSSTESRVRGWRGRQEGGGGVGRGGHLWPEAWGVWPLGKDQGQQPRGGRRPLHEGRDSQGAVQWLLLHEATFSVSSPAKGAPHWLFS